MIITKKKKNNQPIQIPTTAWTRFSLNHKKRLRFRHVVSIKDPWNKSMANFRFFLFQRGHLPGEGPHESTKRILIPILLLFWKQLTHKYPMKIKKNWVIAHWKFHFSHDIPEKLLVVYPTCKFVYPINTAGWIPEFDSWIPIDVQIVSISISIKKPSAYSVYITHIPLKNPSIVHNPWRSSTQIQAPHYPENPNHIPINHKPLWSLGKTALSHPSWVKHYISITVLSHDYPI